jgi:hypothetical protein
MIELKIDNTNLEIPEGFTISIEYSSGIFNFESIQGSYSLPFNLPKTVVNNRLLDFPASLSYSIQTVRKFDAQLWINGILMHEGKLEVTETSEEIFTCTFKFDHGSFASENADILISECELGGEQDWTWRTEYNNTNSDFALPMFLNNSFAANSVIDASIYDPENLQINRYLSASNQYIFKYYLDTFGERDFYTPVCPFPYLYRIIEYLFSYLGYNLLSNFFDTETDLKKIVIYSITDAQQSTTYYNESTEYQHIVYALDTYDLKNHVPEISIHEFILNLKNYFCVDFNFKDDEVQINCISDYINSTDYIDITSKVLDYEQKYFTEAKAGFSIEYSMTDEELTAKDVKKYYLKELIIYEGGGFPTGTIGDLLYGENDYYSVFHYYTYYKPTLINLDLIWLELENRYKSNYYSNYTTDFAFTTNISQWEDIQTDEGNSLFHNEKKSFTTLKLAMDVGIKSEYGNVPRVYMADGDLTLYYWAAKGIFKKFWKPFTDWYFNIKYQLDKKVLFTLADIKKLDFTKKYLINNNLYFIDNVKVVINRDGTLEPSLIRLLPV